MKMIKNDNNGKNNDKWLDILVILLILIKIYSPIGVIAIIAFSIYALIKMAPTKMEDGSLKMKDLKKLKKRKKVRKRKPNEKF